MKYDVGLPGRIIIARADHGDDITGGIKKIIERENIKTAVLYLIGALEKASMVTGPERCTVPPVPNWVSFSDGRELIGLGTVATTGKGTPVIHLHGAVGKERETLAGCIREEAFTYLTMEIIIVEITGTKAFRAYREDWGAHVLDFYF